MRAKESDSLQPHFGKEHDAIEKQDLAWGGIVVRRAAPVRVLAPLFGAGRVWVLVRIVGMGRVLVWLRSAHEEMT